MKRSSRSIAFGVAAFVAVAGLAGCSQAEAPASEDGAGTITVTTNAGGNTRWIQAAIPEFEKLHPDITVVNNAVDGETLLTSAAQLYASNDAPDVGFMQTSMPGYSTLVSTGSLTEVSEVWDTTGLTDAIADNVVTQWSVGDEHFGIPYGQVWAPVIYYNTELFEQAGIDAPDGRIASEADWEEIVDKLQAIGVQPMAIGGREAPGLHIGIAMIQSQSTDDVPYEDFLTNTVAGSDAPAVYDDGTFVDAMQRIVDWNDLGVFANGSANMSGDQALSLFITGQAAMFSNGSYMVTPIIDAGPQFEFGWMLYPQQSASSTPTKFLTYVGDGMVIPSKAKNPVGARLFLEFLASAEGMSLLPAAGTIPVRSDLDPAMLEDFPTQTQEMLAAMETLGTDTILSLDPAVTSMLTAAFGQLLIGEKTPEQLGEEFQSTVDGIRSE